MRRPLIVPHSVVVVVRRGRLNNFRLYGKVREELTPALDLKSILSQREKHVKNCAQRRSPVNIQRIEALYGEFCKLTAALQHQRQLRKQLANQFVRAVEVKDAITTIDDAYSIRERIETLTTELSQVTETLKNETSLLPNETHPGTPIGGAEQNRTLCTFGSDLSLLPSKIIDHVELGQQLGILDFEAASRTSGSAFYFLKGAGALLEQALVQYALGMAIKAGFTPVLPPDIVKSKYVRGCGFFPRAEEDRSILPVYTAEVDGEQLNETPLKVLAGTGEIPLAAYYSGQVLLEAQLPQKWVAISHCFRPETGHHGAESRGLYRVHQFTKVELFVLKDCNGETSSMMLQEILELQKKIFTGLGLHCRLLEMASEELGASAYQKFDIETYLPGRLGWGELSSASNCTDYQSRRLSLRYRPSDLDDLRFAHTLNGTALAVPRLIQAILENFQQSDGSVNIPTVLHPYMLDGTKVITKGK